MNKTMWQPLELVLAILHGRILLRFESGSNEVLTGEILVKVDEMSGCAVQPELCNQQAWSMAVEYVKTTFTRAGLEAWTQTGYLQFCGGLLGHEPPKVDVTIGPIEAEFFPERGMRRLIRDLGLGGAA